MGAYQYILGLQRVFNRIEAIKNPSSRRSTALPAEEGWSLR